MNEQSFVERRDCDWKRLTELTNKAADKRLENLTGQELREFVTLYRRASTDLAIARTKSRNTLLADYLNNITLRAYGVLYRAPRAGFWAAMRNAAATSAQTIRARFRFILVAASIFFGASFLVYGTYANNPEAKDAIVGADSSRMFESWKKGEFQQNTGSQSAMMGAFYASNNPRVAIIEGAVGAATFGAASIYLLFQNGAMIGALASEMSSVGKLPFLISSIAPHGVPELSGAIVGGAAGLLFAWAVINPGRRRRGDALKAVAKDGMVLILTSVALMFIAAPIEGFFSFNPSFPQELKAGVALVSLIAWAAFWIGFGRTTEERHVVGPHD
ncbi:MAG: stage II sporulation protein M [Fimbriimonas sp.]